MNNKVFGIVIMFSLMLLLVACTSSEKTEVREDNGKLTIYTTIYPLSYFTERIGDDFVSVKNMVPPGSDAHTVEITTKTMTKVAESDAFIHTGTGLEAFADAIEDTLKNEDVLIINSTENISLISSNEKDSHNEEEKEEEHDEHAETSDIDPHVWLDPKRSIQIAENIKNALIELNPENKEIFESNFSTLKQELEDLNSDFENMVNKSKNKAFVVSHSAYGYWEDAYGLNQISISGLSPTDEPSQKQLTEIIDLVKENNLQYIFFEQNLTNKIAEIIRIETGTDALTLHNLESISDENKKKNEDYFVIMRKNIKALEKALN